MRVLVDATNFVKTIETHQAPQDRLSGRDCLSQWMDYKRRCAESI